MEKHIGVRYYFKSINVCARAREREREREREPLLNRITVLTITSVLLHTASSKNNKLDAKKTLEILF